MIKFRVLNTITKKIIRDGFFYDAQVQKKEGVGTVVFNSADLRELLSTGQVTMDGSEIYDGDIVEAAMTTDRGVEPMTDAVHWQDGAWRLGDQEGTLFDYVITSVKGNRFENPWPLPIDER